MLYDTMTRIYDDPHLNGFALLSLDFTKAFDLVDHNILLRKMVGHLPNGFLLWVKSYLTDMSFRVRIHGKLSGERLAQAGVPQGSVLGPVLFSILVGDLPSKRFGNTFVQYADDVNIVIALKTKDESEIIAKVSDQMSEIRNWCLNNKQALNAAKSKIMVRSRSTTTTEIDIPLTITNNLRILGVLFNNELTWKDHIDAANKDSLSFVMNK